MNFTTQVSIVRSTFTALFAALICIGCFISVPMPGGIPITIQNLFAILSGLILGGFQGAGAVGLFILLGAIGVPVFSGSKSGFAHLIGPTGGFLWGYFLAAFIGGIIAGTPTKAEKKFRLSAWVRITAGSIAAFCINYSLGIPWFIHVMTAKGNFMTVSKALEYTLIPFIPGDVAKLIVSIPLAAIIRPLAARYLYPDDEREADELIARLKQS